MNAQEKQIRKHVGDKRADAAGAFSFVYGRGWQAHRTMEIAEKARKRDVRAFVRQHGGGDPQNLTRGPLGDRRYYCKNTRDHRVDAQSFDSLDQAISRWYDLGGRAQGWRVWDRTTDWAAEGIP